MKVRTVRAAISVSVVMPAYNAAAWLPKSIPKVADALQHAQIIHAEIIIVDDGSSDDTGIVARNLKTPYPVKVISQINSGRFLARQVGVTQAAYDFILFIDTRIYITPLALKFIVDEMKRKPDRTVWTSHVYLDKSSNVYARFWDALTMLAWRRYFSKPRDCSYGLKDFDHYPKGTTCFFVPKALIQKANNWFITKTKDLKTSNDDTLLIRQIAERTNININPAFSCTYHARSNIRQYCRHVFHRGKVFVDGFLRRDGNRFFWPLIIFLLLSIFVPAACIIYPSVILPLLFVAAIAWILELPISLVLGIGYKDAWALFMLTPLFAVVYGAGIWAAFYRLHLRPTAQR